MFWKDAKSCLNHGIRNPVELDEEKANLEKTVMIYENDVFYERDKSIEKQIVKHYDCIFPNGMDLAWVNEKIGENLENSEKTSNRRYCSEKYKASKVE